MRVRLQELPVIAVDCQTTGVTPKSGQVIELAWIRLVASGKEGTIALSRCIDETRAWNLLKGF